MSNKDFSGTKSPMMCLGAKLHTSSVMVALVATECGGPGKLR